MIDRCEEIRDRIVESVISDLTPEQWSEIEDHVSTCRSCRKYCEEVRRDDRLLVHFIDSLEPSIKFVEERVLERLESDDRVVPEKKEPIRRSVLIWKVVKYAAAAVIVLGLIWGLHYVTGSFSGASPAFASVLEKMREARNVVFQESLQVEGIAPFTIEKTVIKSGIMLSVFPEGDIVIYDFNKGEKMHLMPAEKRAILTKRIGRLDEAGGFNYLEWIRSLHRESGSYKRREKVNRKEAAVFIVDEGRFSTTTIWVDIATELPIRMERVTVPHPDEEIVVPEIALSLLDFGGDEVLIRAASISDERRGISKKSKIVFDDFRWNAEIDESLFSIVPPQGYTLAEQELDVSEGGEQDLIDALSIWAELSDNTFPANINDLCDSSKVKPLLVRAYDKQGDPSDELEEAMQTAHKLLKGLMFAQYRKVEGTWHYTGSGVRLGDAKNPICWWKPEGSEVYRVVYGDLHVADMEADELPPQGQSRKIPFQDEPAAHTLYESMKEAMRNAETMYYESEYRSEMAGSGYTDHCIYRLWMKKPNYARMEATDAGSTPSGILVGDGEHFWIYWPHGAPLMPGMDVEEYAKHRPSNYYKKSPSPAGRHSIAHMASSLGTGIAMTAMQPSIFHGYEDVMDIHLNGVRSIGVEDVDGEECDVIEVRYMDNQRIRFFWISTHDHVPRRIKEVIKVDQEITKEERWSNVTINEEIPLDLFQWRPPEGWVEYREPSLDDGLLKSGTEAPDFNVTLIDGKRIKLSHYRGSVVWLIFWRVGCPPCRVEMPHLEHVYGDLKNRGIEIIGYNCADERKIAEDFIKDHKLSYPNVLDTSEEAQKVCYQDYQKIAGMSAVPLNYIIDRKGEIVEGWYGFDKKEAPKIFDRLKRMK